MIFDIAWLLPLYRQTFFKNCFFFMLSSGENTDSIDNVNKTVDVPKNA